MLGGVGAEHANGHCAEALAVRTARCDFHIIFKDSMSQALAPDRLALPETCGPLLCMFASVPSSLWGGTQPLFKMGGLDIRRYLSSVSCLCACACFVYAYRLLAHASEPLRSFQGLELMYVLQSTLCIKW